MYKFQPDYANCEYSISSLREKKCLSVVPVRSGSIAPMVHCQCVCERKRERGKKKRKSICGGQ